jgi:hypothetical protein
VATDSVDSVDIQQHRHRSHGRPNRPAHSSETQDPADRTNFAVSRGDRLRQLLATPYRLGVVVIVVLMLVWRGWTMSQWSWYMDDWVYLSSTTDRSFLDYVGQNYNSHFMPGQFALVWVLTKFAPLNYGVAVAVTLAFMAASIVAWAMALREIFGERWHLLYAVAVLALSPIFVPVSLWWAAALQVFPLQLCMGACIYFTARAVRRPHQWRPIVGLAIAYALGLAFWEKALLVAIPVFFTAHILSRGIDRRPKRLLRIGAPAALVTAVYIPIYVLFTRGGDAIDTRLFEGRSVSESVDFYFHGIIDLGIPALLGGPWGALSNPQSVYTDTRGSLTMLYLAGAVIAAITALVLRRGSAAPLLMIVTYALVAWGLLLTSSRFTVMGNLSVRDARYAADILPVALLAVMFVVTRFRGERGRTVASSVPDHVLPRVRAGLGALVLAALVSAAVANGATWDALRPTSPKPWVDNAVSDLRRAGPISLYDTVAPNNVILSAFFWGNGRVSRMMLPLRLPLRFNQPTDTIHMIDDSGHVRPMIVSPSSKSVEPAPVPDCGYLVQPGETAFVPITQKMFAWTWAVEFASLSRDGGTVKVQSDTKSAEVQVPSGLTRTQMIVEDSVSALRISSTPSSGPICVSSVTIGNPQPEPRAK